MYWVLREYIKTWYPDLSFATTWSVLDYWHKQLAVRLNVILLSCYLPMQVFYLDTLLIYISVFI